jgi:tetratricopeptide (TPR) repeat protein
MFDLQALKEAKKQVASRDESSDVKFNLLYHEALDALYLFVSKTEYDKESLKKAAEKLAAALEIKKSRAEPYFYLAYIFYLLGKLHLALDYLKVAAFINPDLPGIAALKEEIAAAADLNHANKSLHTIQDITTNKNIPVIEIKEIKKLPPGETKTE